MCDIIEIGGTLNGHFKRNIFCNVKDMNKHTAQFNETDVYATIYKYNNKNQDFAEHIAPLYIDLDIKDIEQNYDKLKRDLLLVHRQLKSMLKLKDGEIQIFFSGSKGYHLIVDHKVLGIQPSRDLNEKYKLLALRLKSFTITKCVDTKIYDKKRLFRLPNTINSKTQLYKVPITLENVKAFSYQQLVEYASQKKKMLPKVSLLNKEAATAFVDVIEKIKEEEKKVINHKLARKFMENKELFPCIKYILQNGAIEGSRNNTANALASALLQIGKPYEEVIEIMYTWNATKNDPALPDAEIETTTKSADKSVSEGKRYGCSTLKSIGICVKGCPIHK